MGKNIKDISLLLPNGYSKLGFLGSNESLETVIAQDSQTLEKLGVSHEEVANAIEKVLLEIYDKRELSSPDSRTPNLYNPETIPHFTPDNLPDADMGCHVGNLQVFRQQYRGFQECPWGCSIDFHWGSFDFLILNRSTGEYFTGPGLIIHLIRQHHFFEGEGTPFRTDPIKAIRVLGLRDFKV